jgi:S-ribosylhomocysteine lyase LuxS involved in autoinducer biosynthesis
MAIVDEGTIRKHIEKHNLLNASQLGFRSGHIMTFQCIMLEDHIALNLNNKMSRAALFLDIEECFDKKLHAGLQCKMSEYL